MLPESLPNILVADELRKSYDKRIALHGLSFTLKAGRVMGFLGPNGAGKTTAIRNLTTILEADSGNFSVDGIGSEFPEKIRARIGVLPESLGFPKQITAIDFLAYFGQLYGQSAAYARSNAIRLLEEVGVQQRAKSLVGTYRRGMRQRLGVARALINNPAVVFLDEPTLGLDPRGQNELLELVRPGLRITPKVAGSYTGILKAFSSGDKSIVYAGSFVSAIIYARVISVPLVHLQDGMEFYAGVLVYPEKENPASLLKDHPEGIAYAVGTSAGEVSAKAATDGKGKVGVSSHGAAISSVVSGKARAAVVKDWWWEGNRSNHPGLASYAIPDISIDKLPDNLLMTSVSIPEPIRLGKTEPGGIGEPDAT